MSGGNLSIGGVSGSSPPPLGPPAGGNTIGGSGKRAGGTGTVNDARSLGGDPPPGPGFELLSEVSGSSPPPTDGPPGTPPKGANGSVSPDTSSLGMIVPAPIPIFCGGPGGTAGAGALSA